MSSTMAGPGINNTSGAPREGDGAPFEEVLGLGAFDQPLPRKVQLRPSVTFMIWISGALVLTLLAATLFVGFLLVHRTVQLQAHGVRTRAFVAKLEILGGERGPPSYMVHFSFTDPSPPDPAEAVQMGTAAIDDAYYRRLFVGAGITVVYLPRRPDIFMLSRDLRWAARDPWHPYKGALIAILLVSAAGGLVFAWFVWRERRLLQWGQYTIARVWDVRTEKRGRGYVAIASFVYSDSTGSIRQGEVSGMRMAIGSSIRSFAKGDTAIAFYDPNKPARVDLYPFYLLMLVPHALIPARLPCEAAIVSGFTEREP